MAAPNPQLKTPANTEQVLDACLQALLTMPELLSALIDRMESVDDSLSVLAGYAQKKGLQEGIFTKEEFEEGHDGSDQA